MADLNTFNTTAFGSIGSSNTSSGSSSASSIFQDNSFDFDGSSLPGFFGDVKNMSVHHKDNRSDIQKFEDYVKAHPEDTAAQDLYLEWLFNERSNTDAYKRELAADSTKYQRMVNDLRAAGLNPMFALSGASAGNVGSSSSSYSSGYETQRHHKESESLTKRGQTLNFISSIISSALGMLRFIHF